MPFICPDCNEDDRYCRCDSYDDDEVDDFDSCPDCNRIDCWGCDGFPDDDDDVRGPSTTYLRWCAGKRRRAERDRAALARFGPRLQRAIRAARERRDVCGDDCLRRGPGKFSHYNCPIPF